jgi:APA family basic amino acid/polyamine antiporter
MVLLLRDFQSLAGSFVFTIWIFYGMAAVAVFILRRRMRHEHRPFRVPGYPLVPAVFVLASLVMTVLALINDWRTNGAWLLILAAGVPVYYAWRRLFPTP